MEVLLVTTAVLALYLLIFLYKLYDQRRNQSCYLLDYVCYKPSDDRKINTEMSEEVIKRNKNLRFKDYKFLLRVVVSSGIGEETYGPRNIFSGKEESNSMVDGIEEMDEFFESIEELFRKTDFSPRDIDILVVNISTMTTCPSFGARIVNKYKLREDVKLYNISGMGCSASLISIDVIQNMFKTHRKQLAMVVTSESISPNYYAGNERSMILANCLFRSGGCSMLLTNDPALKRRAKMKLSCLIRTHIGADDDAYECAIQKEDDKGYTGVNLSKNIPNSAARAFLKNLISLAPKILPLTEIIKYAVKKPFRRVPTGTTSPVNFKAGIDHFIIHPGGAAVINGIGQSMGLNGYDLEPSRMTLHRFGNTSASSLWYVLGYMEAKKRLKKGEKIMMLSFGAGFKCCSCVWKLCNDLYDENVWKDCIANYPRQNLDNPYLERFGWINDK